MAIGTCKRKTAGGSSLSGASKTKQSKRQMSKDIFEKWQRTYEKEHQSVAWLRAEMDDQDKSLVSTLWCIVGSMRLEYVGSKISPGHGSMVQATIKRATSPTTPTVSRTKRPWCIFVGIRPKTEMSQSLATAPSLVVFCDHQWIQLWGSESRSLILAFFLQKNIIFLSWSIQQSMN